MSDAEMNMDEERIRKLICAELAGEIAPEEEAELQQALAESPRWMEVYDEEKRLSALLAEDRASLVPSAGLADRIADRVLAADLDQEDDHEEAPAILRFLRPLALAASLLLVVGVSFWSGRQSTVATPDVSQSGLKERQREILESRPDLDAARIEGLFSDALERLRELEDSHDAERSAILEELEVGIGELLEEKRER